MSTEPPPPSRRRDELLEAAYAYLVERGVSEFSLRPMAQAIGSSPRVLLYLFGSKDGLTRAVLARLRADELARLEQWHQGRLDPGLRGAAGETWGWLIEPRHRPLLRTWLAAYTRSVTEPDGPWRDFAAGTVADWRMVLSRYDVGGHARPGDADTVRDAVVAVLRGALLDLLATGDVARTTAAVECALDGVVPAR